MESSFAEKVYRLLQKVPAGKLTTYGALAKALGKKGAARAVGQALGKNPQLVRLPCHRVIKNDGSLGGYAEGVRKKMALLRKEGVIIRHGRVIFLEKHLHTFIP
ncbi:MGMT family protein [Candidatus Uhrbacteria bacterium]|nr:MGMT family protein [Candidatus Uhrbacteria bacterium]